MNEETKKFLTECKKAGYEFVTIYIQDKRVPITVRIEKYGEQKYHTLSGGLVAPSAGEYWGETWRMIDGEKIIRNTCKVVAAAPERRESGRPALWKICEESSLTAGLGAFRGTGFGESHSVQRYRLTAGFYDLKEFAA